VSGRRVAQLDLLGGGIWVSEALPVVPGEGKDEFQASSNLDATSSKTFAEQELEMMMYSIARVIKPGTRLHLRMLQYLRQSLPVEIARAGSSPGLEGPNRRCIQSYSRPAHCDCHPIRRRSNRVTRVGFLVPQHLAGFPM
jgi:hypothetical protein